MSRPRLGAGTRLICLRVMAPAASACSVATSWSELPIPSDTCDEIGEQKHKGQRKRTRQCMLNFVWAQYVSTAKDILQRSATSFWNINAVETTKSRRNSLTIAHVPERQGHVSQFTVLVQYIYSTKPHSILTRDCSPSYPLSTLPTCHYTAVARRRDMCNSKTPPSTIVHPRWPRRPHLDEPLRSTRRHHVQARSPLSEQVSARNDTHCFPQALLRHLAYAADLHANTDHARDLEASRARLSTFEIVRVAVYIVPSYGKVGKTDTHNHNTHVNAIRRGQKETHAGGPHTFRTGKSCRKRSTSPRSPPMHFWPSGLFQSEAICEHTDASATNR